MNIVDFFTRHIKHLLVATLVLFSTLGNAQTKQKTRILFMFDASQSMLGQWDGQQKIKIATRLLSNVMDSLKSVENLEVALRVYGHQFSVAAGERSCEDTKLEVPFGSDGYDEIKTTLGELYPKGTTPIAYSLEQTKNDFPWGTGLSPRPPQ